ncbi:amino acid permease [Solirubrobacter ginsenosidimutans]|uniref:Amino acid permease n=1 Tax=Solirubrobacter ginsenosidimutans TaxID=490573 RepID=A0A9X3MNU1_9ACTN|nr:amino acid permease [Solirubrobacter ginsenosidimutans]MDA0159624.1 amino acid permease [Solirubrobacter ginsenosidimutans]
MKVTPLKRQLGSPALFGIVQGFIAASIYFSTGLVAERALGLTWAVFLAGGVLFAVIVPSYVEGASLHQERGGATVIARYAFNELVSFIAGWAICLDYLILVALCAFASTDYLALFWSGFSEGLSEFLIASAIVLYVALMAIRGAGPRHFERAAVFVLGDLILQLLIVGFGMALIFQPEVLTDPSSIAGSPSMEDMIFAFPLVLVAFSGIDASSGLAGQVAIGRRGLRRLIGVRLVAAMVPYLGIALVASAALPPTDGKFVEAPMLGIADAFEQAWIREPAKYLVAISALVILISAAQAAMLGLSRLGYALAVNRQIPSKVGSLSRTRATPVGIIGFGAVMAICLLIPADLEFLAAICAFGATIAFTIVGASVVWLRYKEPDRDRPYRMPLNVRFRGGSLPIPAVLCVVMSSIAFLSLLIEHGSARWVGVIWMAAGVSLYVGYRTSQGKPVLKRVTVPEAALTHRAAEAEFGSMLVPILGTPLDDDIMQTAGRLAAEENADDGEGGAVIEALWIFEVPMALPLDTRVPDPELKRARAALNRAKAVGEEYQGVEVATAVVRARRAGQAIVREAKRRGVEAIVLAAEEPTRVGGGLRLGGKPGLHDTSVGETTRYVVNKAHCRVILTAPPAKKALDPMGPVPSEPPLPLGHALGVSESNGAR